MRRIALAATFTLLLAACDSTADGPGTIDAIVEAPQALGAVVLEFTGGGVEGFDGQGDTQVYSALVAQAESRYRVILVSPEGGPLRFGIRVANVREAQPAVTAVTAVSPTNQFVTPTGLQVRLQR